MTGKLQDDMGQHRWIQHSHLQVEVENPVLVLAVSAKVVAVVTRDAFHLPMRFLVPKLNISKELLELIDGQVLKVLGLTRIQTILKLLKVVRKLNVFIFVVSSVVKTAKCFEGLRMSHSRIEHGTIQCILKQHIMGTPCLACYHVDQA